MGSTLTRRIHSRAFSARVRTRAGHKWAAASRCTRAARLRVTPGAGRSRAHHRDRSATSRARPRRTRGKSPSLGDRFAVAVGRGSASRKLAMIRSEVLIDADIRVQHRRNGDDEATGWTYPNHSWCARTAGSFAMALSRRRPKIDEADRFNPFGADFIEVANALGLGGQFRYRAPLRRWFQ